MTKCAHAALELLPARKRALRCRHCHLTLAPDEADAGCPECFERSGKRYHDFEELDSAAAVSYRCEQCGAIVKCA